MPPAAANSPVIDYSSTALIAKHAKVENNTQSRAKISFSIDSIIGIKWNKILLVLQKDSFLHKNCDSCLI